MVGSKCFKVLAGIFIPFLCFFVMSENTAALVPSKIASSLTISRSTVSPDWHTVVQNHNSALPITLLSYQGPTLQVRTVQISSSVSPSQTGQYYSGSYTIKLRFNWIDPQNVSGSFLPNCANITRADIRPEQGTVVSSNFTIQSCSGSFGSFSGTYPDYFDLTIKVQGSGKLSASTTVSSYFITIDSEPQKPFYTANFPAGTQQSLLIPSSGVDINFILSNDSSTSSSGDTSIGITNLNNTIKDHYDKENQAINNIENQTAPSGTENQATTNLIGVLSSFLSQLSSFQATNCELTLPFPSFIGGSQIVNICQGKDILGNFITIIGSLTMIVFYVPLALVLLRLIYNEIRSFTNG